MSCLLTSGRSLPCKSSSVGGLKAVYFADYGTLGTPTIVDGEITAFDGTAIEFFKFDIKGNSTLETAINSSRENGSLFYTQTLNLTLPKLDKATQEEVKLLASGRPHIAIEDYNGNFFLVGLENGADVNGGTIVTGGSMSEMSGFTLTFEAMETEPAYFVTPSIVTDATSDVVIDPTA
jgi:hypothetical protein